MKLNGCYRTKVNSKAFAIPNLTAFFLYQTNDKADAVRIETENTLELTFAL